MAYKDKAKQKATERDRQRRYRKTAGHPADGEGVTPRTKGVTFLLGTPDILLKLTDPFWRGRLAKICDAFEHSHNPRYKEEVWLGDTNVSLACDYLECTG